MPGPAGRTLPPVPARITSNGPVPHLDSACYFPWFGVQGCAGHDVRAMLAVTNAALIEARARPPAIAGWYEDVRRHYRAGR